MNVGDFAIEAMDRPVIRVKVKRPVGQTRYRYFSSVSSAARYLAWQQVYATYRVFMPEYMVNGMSCECERNYWSGAQTDNSECPLHNHDDGFYVCEMRRIKTEILAAWQNEMGAI